MDVTVQGVGGPEFVADGVAADLRLGKNGQQIVAELAGKYYEDAYRAGLGQSPGGIFHAGAASNIPASGTAAGPVLYNPVNSGKNVIPIKIRLSLPATTTAAGTVYIAYATGLTTAPTGTTNMAAAPYGPGGVPGAIGSASRSVGQAFSAATLAAAAAELFPLAQKATAVGIVSLADDLDGSLILPPGSLITLYTSAADTTPAHNVGFSWQEAAV